MNRTLRVVTTLVFSLVIVFINVTALLFFLTAFSGLRGEGEAAPLLGIPGRYAILYHMVAIFAPAFISVSLGNLLRRIAGFTPDFLLRIFWFEFGGMFLFFLALLIMHYLQSYH